MEVFGSSDYTRLAGASKEYLWSLWPTTYENVFRAVMDDFAIREGAIYWLEKSPAHTPLLPFLAKVYPDAVFIGITREITEVAASTLKMIMKSKGKLSPFIRKAHLAQHVFLKIYYDRVMNNFAYRNKQIMLIRFSDFKAEPETILKNICKFLNLEYFDDLVLPLYKKNSSFKSKEERQGLLTQTEKSFCRWAEKTIKIGVPFWLMNAVYDTLKKPNQKKQLPVWFFKLGRAD